MEATMNCAGCGTDLHGTRGEFAEHPNTGQEVPYCVTCYERRMEAGDAPDDTYYGDEDAEIEATPSLQRAEYYCRECGWYIGTPCGRDIICRCG